MDRGAWRATVHAVAKNQRPLGDKCFPFFTSQVLTLFPFLSSRYWGLFWVCRWVSLGHNWAERNCYSCWLNSWIKLRLRLVCPGNLHRCIRKVTHTPKHQASFLLAGTSPPSRTIWWGWGCSFSASHEECFLYVICWQWTTLNWEKMKPARKGQVMWPWTYYGTTLCFSFFICSVKLWGHWNYACNELPILTDTE